MPRAITGQKPIKKAAPVLKKIDPKLIPEVNIGTLGHVDHGKSTLVEAITGKWPALHSEELKRGITIRLGYADATIYQCPKCKKFSTSDKCLSCMEKAEPARTVSFVDAPGHEMLMATVLAVASLMDGAILVISAGEKCPQPQTSEHLTTLNITGIRKIIIIQNKIDLVSEEQAKENYNQIKKFVKGTVAENAPIIPVSSQQKINIDAVLEAIQEVIPTPERKEGSPKMLVVRSFDINKPGTEPEKLTGGVLGGALIQGKLKIGEEIEIRPGIKEGNKWRSIKTKVTGLQKVGKNLGEAGPGGLLGLMTSLDPGITKSDGMIGNVVGLQGKLPPVLDSIKAELNLFEKIPAEEETKIAPLKAGEPLLINIGTARTLGLVKTVGKICELELKIPICAEAGERFAVSRKVQDRWRLIGWGILK